MAINFEKIGRLYIYIRQSFHLQMRLQREYIRVDEWSENRKNNIIINCRKVMCHCAIGRLLYYLLLYYLYRDPIFMFDYQ